MVTKFLGRIVIAELFLIGSLLAGEKIYSDSVKSLYADASSAKAIGRLLPTNAVTVVQKSGERIKIAIRGYQNPDVKNVIYYSDSQRVIAAAFSKTANIETRLLEKGKGGKWDKVEVSVYTEEGGFGDGLEAMFEKAGQIYNENCSICHALPEPSHSKANQWPSLLQSMLSRTAIDKKDEWLVIQYLQKHSEDVK